MEFADLEDIVRAFRVVDGDDFDLAEYETRDDDAVGVTKAEAAKLVSEGVARLARLQEKLYAHNRWAVLLIFQAMDAAGKDSTIKHVMSGVNPQGCQVHAFKRPSEEELDHDFLWRTTKALPERGRIGLFNRSYYEETLVVRVHPRILDAQRLPAGLVDDDVWEGRFESIREFEEHLARNGTLIVKFFLHLSREEQKERLIARIDEPDKNWKFEAGDLVERARWDDYMAAYEAMIRATARKRAPWYVIPADDKPFMRMAVVAAIVRELEKLDLAFPEIEPEQRAKLLAAKRQLLAERDD